MSKKTSRGVIIILNTFHFIIVHHQFVSTPQNVIKKPCFFKTKNSTKKVEKSFDRRIQRHCPIDT